MPKPNFLIVGSAKCGTTSVYQYLKQHNDVFMPEWKEPAYFAPNEAGGVQTEEEYLKLFENVKSEKMIGEASVAYLYAENAAEDIASYLGKETKIVIFLRNPVDMAYSNWGHQVREGFEDLSFEDAIEAEKERQENKKFNQQLSGWVANLLYKKRASYSHQIERYDKVFGRNNVRIYIYEDFFKPELPEWEDLCEFLQISPTNKPKAKKYNPAGRMRSRFIQDVLRKRMAWKEPIKVMMPMAMRNFIRDILEKYNRKDAPQPSLSPETRKSLESYFEQDVKWLEERIGRSLENTWFKI